MLGFDATCSNLSLFLFIAWRPEAFQIEFQRDSGSYQLLDDFLDALLTTVFELLQYSVYLQASPNSFAVLLTTQEDHVARKLPEEIVARLEKEWTMVLEMESNPTSAALLRSSCPYTRHQMYRELHGALEASQHKITEPLKQLVQAWFPGTTSSSVVEDVFASMADNVKRSTKKGSASLAGLQAVAVRSTNQHCSRGGEERGLSTVQLESADHEGNEVRGLRSSIWRPESAPSSVLHALSCRGLKRLPSCKPAIIAS